MLSPAEDLGPADRRIGAELIRAGKLDEAALSRAINAAAATGASLVQTLPKLGLISDRDLAAALADCTGLREVEAGDWPDTPLFAETISLRFLRDSLVLPLWEEEGRVGVAVADPGNNFALQALEVQFQCPLDLRISPAGEIEQAIDRLYVRGPENSDVAQIVEGDEPDIEQLKDLASEAPVIQLVSRLITRAAEQRASDIHLEPFEHSLRVRYRIDGVLREVGMIPAQLRAAVSSRVKIMARLNIAERRLPQDGRIKYTARGTPIDLRVSTVPTLHGECIVLRLLDRGSSTLEFEPLGITGPNLDRYLRLLDQPNGIFLVTGPTGSGKTTTLYAALSRLNSTDAKIITVEDPVEYQLAGVNQIQVKPAIGLTFATVLRSLLRQDPDIILIGEIRDLETAQIAAQAALTGHLVLSTLHTNGAAATVTRLLDMGLEDYLLTATLNGVAAQRLVRTLCPQCKEPFDALPELLDQLGLCRSAPGKIQLHRAVGCEACGGTGYRGRTSIAETLIMTDRIRQLVLRRGEARDIQAVAVEDGMTTMFEDGLRKALAGITTYQEVLRATRDV